MTINDQSDEQAKQLPIVKTDVLGRIKIDPKHREAMLDAWYECIGFCFRA